MIIIVRELYNDEQQAVLGPNLASLSDGSTSTLFYDVGSAKQLEPMLNAVVAVFRTRAQNSPDRDRACHSRFETKPDYREHQRTNFDARESR